MDGRQIIRESIPFKRFIEINFRNDSQMLVCWFLFRFFFFDRSNWTYFEELDEWNSNEFRLEFEKDFSFGQIRTRSCPKLLEIKFLMIGPAWSGHNWIKLLRQKRRHNQQFQQKWKKPSAESEISFQQVELDIRPIFISKQTDIKLGFWYSELQVNFNEWKMIIKNEMQCIRMSQWREIFAFQFQFATCHSQKLSI